MTRYKYWILIWGVLYFSACDKDFEVDYSVQADYNLLFEYLKNDYAYRDYHHQSMEALRLKYLPLIEANPTEGTLADVILKLRWEDLQDPHFYPNLDLSPYSSISKPASTLETIKPLFHEINIIQSNHFYTYGTVNSDSTIGYIYVNAFNSKVGGSSSLGVEDGVSEINAILQIFETKGIHALIVDIRSYAGGSNYVPRYIAQRFSNKEAIYMNEYYPVGTGFQKKEWMVKPQGTIGFRTGKVALLSNGRTCSGGEMFVLAMLQRDNLVHIGSRSLGCTGNITHKDLSNGWGITMTNSRTEHPDGTSYFKVGITPNIIIENDSTYGDSSFEDQLIKQALIALQ